MMKNKDNNKKQTILRAFRTAFPLTIPIFAGFWFLGLTYFLERGVQNEDG